MAKHEYGEPEAFRGYTLILRYTDGKLTMCNVWRPNKIERDDEHAATFWGPDARSKAKRWILAEEARQK